MVFAATVFLYSMMFKTISLCVLLALLCAPAVHSLVCYACQGDVDSDCAQGIDMMEVLCTSEVETVCTAHDIESNSLRLITRGCVIKSDPDLCSVLAGDTGITLHSCVICDDDYCNA